MRISGDWERWPTGGLFMVNAVNLEKGQAQIYRVSTDDPSDAPTQTHYWSIVSLDMIAGIRKANKTQQSEQL